MILGLAAVAAVAAATSAVLVRLLRPLLVRYALARPNARSSHAVPTPQGGGVAVLAAALVAAAIGLVASALPVGVELRVLCVSTLVLAVIGAIDDVRPLSAGLRLVGQAVCVGGLLWAMQPLRLLPAFLPASLEWALLLLAGLWWVNLVNFMDGIDWLTVAEVTPLGLGICLFGLAGSVPPHVALVAAALVGGLLGFAPANRPVARLFLGDVGSLPIGLLTGWMLLHLAASGGFAAAVLLPMYYGADATLTLLRRLGRGEPVWHAHREHAYQRALVHGFRVIEVVRLVFGLNLALMALAAATLRWTAPAVQLAALAVGAALTAAALRRLRRPRSL